MKFTSKYAVICCPGNGDSWVHTLAFSETDLARRAAQYAGNWNPTRNEVYDAEERLRDGAVFSYAVNGTTTWYVGRITDDELREVGLL